MAKYAGTGQLAAADYKSVKWVGQTKGGNAVTITMPKAVNLGNIDWAFAEKDDTVAQIVFTAVYENTDAASSSMMSLGQLRFLALQRAEQMKLCSVLVYFILDLQQ